MSISPNPQPASRRRPVFFSPDKLKKFSTVNSNDALFDTVSVSTSFAYFSHFSFLLKASSIKKMEITALLPSPEEYSKYFLRRTFRYHPSLGRFHVSHTPSLPILF